MESIKTIEMKNLIGVHEMMDALSNNLKFFLA